LVNETDLINALSKLKKDYTEQSDTIQVLTKEISNLNNSLYLKDKSIEAFNEEKESLHNRILELEEIERARISQIDFNKASDVIPQLYVHKDDAKMLFSSLRMAIEREKQDRDTNNRIVFVISPRDKMRVINAYYQKRNNEGGHE
jgi:predicted nuclease with TOPRIM domain